MRFPKCPDIRDALYKCNIFNNIFEKEIWKLCMTQQIFIKKKRLIMKKEYERQRIGNIKKNREL